MFGSKSSNIPSLKKNEWFCVNCKKLLVINSKERRGEIDIHCPVCDCTFSLEEGREFINNISEITKGPCPHCGTNLVFDLKDRMPGSIILCPRCNKQFDINETLVEENKNQFKSEKGEKIEDPGKLIPIEANNSLSESLRIPEPTRSLVWITDEDPSLAESPMSINITISLTENGGVESSMKKKGFYSEPSLIWTKLPVEENNELETEAMYYPRYAAFDSGHRYQYLNWLRDITQPTNLSYVFLYFYGLERHMLIGDYDGAVDEIIRLMKHHKKGSFISYATRSLIVASIARDRMDVVKRAPFILEEEVDEALALRIMLGTPLTGEDVMQMAYSVGFKNHRYIKLYPEQFEETLNGKIVEFEKQFGPILKIFDIGSFKREPRSVFANMSIPDDYRVVKVPQIVSNQKFKTAMFNLLQATHDSIKEDLREKRKRSK